MSEEYLEKRFGVVAFEKGFVTGEQVLEAMSIQVKADLEEKEHLPIGGILVSLGYMKDSEADEVLVAMMKDEPKKW